jgi:hypothetical protein
MTQQLTLTKDQFDDAFPLVRNHLNPDAAWDGCLFETHGEELAFVARQEHRAVFTLVESDGDDDADLFILSGYHRVNRLGYLISSRPVEPRTHIVVGIRLDPEFDDATEHDLITCNEGAAS